MDIIFHEKQEGSLCAQHCLNALLQGPYFTAVDLASLAEQLDDEERKALASGGTDSMDYQRLLRDGSRNMDDSGYFSVQVISKALGLWELELVPFQSQRAPAPQARNDPTTQQAFICNFQNHWLTIRRIGMQWFNLNSVFTGPKLLTNTYLSLFLAQLQQEGYSIFIVVGALPRSEADEYLDNHTIPVTSENISSVVPDRQNAQYEENDLEMQQALEASRLDDEEFDNTLQTILAQTRQEAEENDLARALELSQQYNAPENVKLNSEPNTSEKNASGSRNIPNESSGGNNAPDLEYVRNKRLQYLDSQSRKN